MLKSHNKKKTIEFVIPHIAINRNDDLEMREKILSMSLEDRKRLGINKSTLWYMKKNFADNKTRKIYSKVSEKLHS